VIAIDRFGNAVTNLLSFGGGAIEVEGRQVQVRRVYEDVAPGAALAARGLERAARDRGARGERRRAPRAGTRGAGGAAAARLR
jgi:hypothetical protein